VTVTDQLKASFAPMPAEMQTELLGMMDDVMAMSGLPQEIAEAKMEETFAEYRAFFRKGAFRIR